MDAMFDNWTDRVKKYKQGEIQECLPDTATQVVVEGKLKVLRSMAAFQRVAKPSEVRRVGPMDKLLRAHGGCLGRRRR